MSSLLRSARTPMLATTAMLLALVAMPAVAQEGQSGGVLKILGSGDIDHFDAASVGVVTSNNFIRATQRTLVGYDSSTDPAEGVVPKPDLAVELPQPGDDGLTYTFTLRDGAAWDINGTARPIVAADFERGIKRMCNPVLGSSFLTYFTSLIVGMDEFCDGFAKVAPTAEAMKAYVEGTDIPGIETPDDKTVTFHLKEKAGDFIYMLSLPSAAPAPVEILDYIPDSPDFRKNFMASGPYTVADYVPDSTLKLKRNPAWNADSDPLRKAYVDEIELTFGLQPDAAIQQIQAGDADMLYDILVPPALLPMLQATGDDKLVAISVGRTSFIFINTVADNNNGALKDLKVRQALNYAIDKAAIVQQMGGSYVAAPQAGIFGPGLVGYHDFAPYPSADHKGDPEKAKALLAEAGFPDGIKLKMPFRNINDEPAIAQTIQASMKKAGIELELIPVSAADYYSKYMTNQETTKTGAWDIAPVSWSPDWVGGAARSVFQPQFSFDGRHQTYNYTDYNNDAANAKAAEAINAVSADEAGKLWAGVDELVMADAPVVPFISQNVVVYHSEAVKNFLPYALGANGDWSNLWLER
ncbi:ABC transporter substrate-binding protein [Paracoccus sp. CPCC 101403]|uniref:ABC transporter substrate-binding protein n=1 Tax=Paracoccus broussonetiae TaxID=3075834 RepID=A0ABU3E9D1_9RHOB|nr:ABC transporter substrate-binding protein [Paracoccus sp. CPCC 101403]MDT1060827.1 ABC transporter substrate-binding protein [Paracoccus sp. CPCC 101403]